MLNTSRQYVFLGIVFSILLIYILRLFYVQVISDEYAIFAEKNAIRKAIIYPARGLIYDRKGRLIVANKPVYDLKVIPHQMKKGMDTVGFCQLIGIDKNTFIEKIKKIKKYSKYKETLFLTQIEPEQFIKIRERLFEFPGFFADIRTVRNYLYPNAAHLLGYIGEVDSNIIKKSNFYYMMGDYIGISGVEYGYEKYLRGKRGVKFQYVDVHNRIQGSYKAGKYDSIAVSGNNLYLGIDIELQKLGEQLMQGKKGSLVAIDPATGEILALVSSPNYNPNDLVGTMRGKRIRAMQIDSLKPLYNRALSSGLNPPGSTFKLIHALIGLQEGVLTPETRYPCHGGFPVLGGRPRCHAHPSPADLNYSITTSCNSYYCYVFRSIINNQPTSKQGLDVWRNYMTAFGLGKKTNIELTGEAKGSIPSNAYYDRFHGADKWNALNIISLSIGQGEVGMTPLQMANVAAIIANRGYYINPHVAHKFEGTIDPNAIKKEKKFVPIQKKYFEIVVEGMHNVTIAGTARVAQIEGIEVCGKTGTAQNPHGKDNSIFLCFAPKHKPKIAMGVYIENAGFGATYAAPIASLMMEKYLNDTIATKRLPLQKRMETAVVK